MAHNHALTRDINYVPGPEGQTVVVARPNQAEIPEMEEVNDSEWHTVCALFWGLLAFPIMIVGFVLLCIGLSYLKTNPDHPVIPIGQIFFGIGVLMALIFWMVMCYYRRSQKRRVNLYMHRSGRGHEDFTEDIQPVQLPSVEEFNSALTPYERFTMYRGSRNVSPNTSAFGRKGDQRSACHTAPPQPLVNWPFQENTATSISQSQQLPPPPGDSFQSNDQVEFPEGSANSSRLQRHSEIPSSGEQGLQYGGSSSWYRQPRESGTIPIDLQCTQIDGNYRTSRNLPRESYSSPLRGQMTPIRSSASEISLDHLLSDMTALSSSLGMQLDEETRSFPVRENRPMLQPPQPSGRRSPYDNSFP